jgi:putative FmdB family regulatory protein
MVLHDHTSYHLLGCLIVGLFDSLRAFLSGNGATDESETETFEYRCRDCDTEFESTRQHVTTVSCPDCGSDDIRVSEDPY